MAIQTIRRLVDEYGIYFAENDPCRRSTCSGWPTFDNVPVPVMADESCYTLQGGTWRMARAGAADILSIYVGKGGGIGPAKDRGRRRGAGVDLHRRR